MLIPIALILALISIESNGNNDAKGDNDRAYGCLQIWECYVQDANQYAGTQYVHEDAFSREAAIAMFRAYMARYANERRLGRPVTAEDIASIHNGGPNGFRKPATEAYWQKVKAELLRMGETDLAHGKPIIHHD
jgi:hypothetical protein